MLQEQEVSILYTAPDVTVSAEGVGSDEMVMIHVDVHTKMTKGLYEDWLLIFQEVKSKLNGQGYDIIMTSHDKLDIKMKKFWEMFGFDVFTYGKGMIAFTLTTEDK